MLTSLVDGVQGGRKPSAAFTPLTGLISIIGAAVAPVAHVRRLAAPKRSACGGAGAGKAWLAAWLAPDIQVWISFTLGLVVILAATLALSGHSTASEPLYARGRARLAPDHAGKVLIVRWPAASAAGVLYRRS